MIIRAPHSATASIVTASARSAFCSVHLGRLKQQQQRQARAPPMQSRLLQIAHAGELCRHLNVLRPSSCSTSVPVAQPTGRRQHHLQQAAALADAGAAGWTYKYKRLPCPSPCGKDDRCCQEVEALIQNVLSYPNMPMRIARLLPGLRADTRSMTALVEALAGHFGKELTLVYLRKQPKLLEFSFATVLARCEALKEVVGVRDSDIPQMLRKCPSLLLLEPGQLRQRYEHIPRMIHFTPLQVRMLVVKYPTVLTQSPGFVAGCVERLRQLCYTREEWARDFECMSPSLLAYFLRDATDQLMRLEYLASTGERPEWLLREVMKPTNRTFRMKLRNYGQWELRVKQRRAQQKAAAAEAAQQAARSAEAAAIKAAILSADSSSDDGTQPPPPRRRRA